MRATFTKSADEAANIKTFYFEKPSGFSYIAGQFIEMTLPHAHPDKRGTRHWFTLSSSPEKDYLTITTKFAERSSTFKQTLAELAPGSKVEMSEPMGDFILPKDAARPLLFVAGGIGITPFHSIMEYLADTGQKRDIKFIYGVGNEDEIVFEPTWQKVGVHATIVVGEPSQEWGGERGRLSADLIMGLGEPGEDTLVYVSGPEPMVESLEKSLKKAGLKDNQLVLDFFPNYENSYSD